MNEEKPTFEVLQEFDGYELRRYDASVWTTAMGATNDMFGWGDSAFAKLFNYISGANEFSQKIEMTSPVLWVADANKERQWFYLQRRVKN